MNTVDSTVGLLQLFADPTRVRLLSLLSARELTVADLTTVTELAQSSVSTHLGRLREAGMLRDRRSGPSTYYSVNELEMPAQAKSVWGTIVASLDDRVLAADRARCEALLRARESKPSWPDVAAGQMERTYSPGRTWESIARAFVGLIRLGDVLDVGCGDGSVAELIVERSRTLTCLESNETMLAAARQRLAKREGARFVHGDMEALPFEAAQFDHVLLFNLLTLTNTPARVAEEAARVLRPGGDVTVVTLEAHEHADVTAAYEHRHPGFDTTSLRQLLTRCGFDVTNCAVTSRERRPPYFGVVTAFATRTPKRAPAA